MSAFASTSRLRLGAASKVSASTSTRRLLATTARARECRVTLALASRRCTFVIPTLISLLQTFWPQIYLPQLAIAGGNCIHDSSQDSSEILDWDGVLNAVPKSKVSHSRKAMRHANKGLKDRVDLVHCQGCGKPKLAHHICASCYSIINRAQKAAKKEQLHSE